MTVVLLVMVRQYGAGGEHGNDGGDGGAGND